MEEKVLGEVEHMSVMTQELWLVGTGRVLAEHLEKVVMAT